MNNHYSAHIIYPMSFTFSDYPDNVSYATLVYFLGCGLSCQECYNPDLKTIDHPNYNFIDMDYFLDYLKTSCNKSKTNKVVFSGGNPLDSLNIDFVRYFVKTFGEEFDICIYTGYNIEYVKKENIKGFKYIKTGVYDLTKKQQQIKTDDYMQLSSSNQEFYDENYNLLSVDGKFYFNK